ncbi:MAG: tRNA pseudouridine(54/55) synthase Pus10 [Candidatus Aenigmarchaeota archaeon]|nr:tRNA pseudouridine(54/55) synthase Pus10 [Candidatus Aenigmarchaeota archaeon]
MEKAFKILRQPVCDSCLGRQYAQLLSGYSNVERGRILRSSVAMHIDNEETKHELDMSNFSGYDFHNLEMLKPAAKKCSVCDGLLENIDKLAKGVSRKAKKYDFRTFLIGTKLSFDLLSREEELWERIGVDDCEPLKAELNREVGKRLEKLMGKKFDAKRPDISFLLDLNENRVEAGVNPLFIYGEYQKLVRGIPQTKWPSGKYKNSVEQIIAKPFMKASGGKIHKLHAQGREDIDARCLAWRPFVLEITEPRNRSLNLKTLSRKIGKGVRIRGMKFCSVSDVRKLKETKSDKTYRAVVKCEKFLQKKDLAKLKHLVSEVRQKTPHRVLHRRADLTRKRKVKALSARYVNRNTFLLTVRGEAGLYIKELVSGDEGRTSPSVSEILGNQCRCKELDVVKIHK